MNTVPRSTFLLIFSFLTLPVSAMNQMFAVRSSIPSTTMRPVLTRSIVSIPRKRTLHECACIANFRGYDLAISLDRIDDRNKYWEHAWQLIQHKKQLQQEGKWPALTGKALEREFRSKRYCRNFESCSYRASVEAASFPPKDSFFPHHDKIVLASIAQDDLIYLAPILCAFRHEQRKLIDALREKVSLKDYFKDTEKE